MDLFYWSIYIRMPCRVRVHFEGMKVFFSPPESE